MKKIISLAVVVSVLLICLFSCNTRYVPVYGESILGPYFDILELPTKKAGGETTLEFWIGEKIVERDYENHEKLNDGFLGKGYKLNPDNPNELPEFYVRYVVERYPEVFSKTKGVTKIEITDPNVMVYGLTTESSVNDFEDVFKELGADVSVGIKAVVAKLNDATFILFVATVNSPPIITITTEPSRAGIVCID